jgi:hypothetical protein
MTYSNTSSKKIGRPIDSRSATSVNLTNASDGEAGDLLDGIVPHLNPETMALIG